jgi:RNA polymerase sigma-70 factor (ECF subfamily)
VALFNYLKKTDRLFTFVPPWGFNRYMAPEKLQLPLAFEQIMQRHEREIMRYLLRASGNGADAADLFQETWLRAYRAYPRLEPESEVRPWLYAIAVNLCRNRARDGARRARVIVADEEENPAADRIVKSHRGFNENEGYAAVRLRELIALLPPKQREALQLRYFAGLDFAEIAGVMDCSEQGARANLSQAMRKIKSMW